MRLPPTAVLGVALVVAPGVAAAAAPEPGTDYVVVPPQRHERRAGTAHVVYLNRCADGCFIDTSVDDADANGSTIPETGGPLSPFAYGDDAWNQVVACVRASYAPFAVEVVTEPPAAGSDYVEVMLAGSPFEVGLDGNILGIAPLTSDCSTQSNVLAFAFANLHNGNILDMCATAAHEAGHTFGLDHEFECRDPMTYLVDCGQKAFLNLEAPCGEFDGPRACRCSGDTQDSYKKLVADLGPGTLPVAPVVTIAAPDDGTVISDGVTVFVQTVELRTVIRVELWINGWRWTDATGTTTQTLFQIPIPAAVPDGVLDLEARAFNDVGAMGQGHIRVTKGAPCTTAATCADGQTCDGEGRCVYPPPAGQLGDTCTRDLDCATTRCLSDGTNRVCSSACLTDFAGTCPDGFTCVQTESPTSGACWPDDLLPSSGGCCEAGGGGGGGGAPVALSLATLALLLGRRRRPAAPRRV